MKKVLCLLFVLLIIFSGCVGKNPATPNNSAKGSITLTIKASGLTGKTIQPDLDMNIAAYDVYGMGPDGVNFRKDNQTSSTVSLEALAAGFWTITVDAKNDEGIIIASGCTNVTVISGISTSVDVTVTPLTGTGALKVNLAWPGGTMANPNIYATLTPKGGIVSDIAFTLNGDGVSAVYENNALEAGYYTLLVYLYDGSVFKWGAAEAVRIIKNQTSEGNYPVIPGGADIGDINMIITPDLQNPVGITFTGATENLLYRTNMTVTATTTEEVDSYQWYLNGKPLSGETSNIITIGSALPRGNYRLDLLVMKRMIISSATLNFMVSDSGVTPVTPIIAMSGGSFHTLALKTDGTVWAWGYNEHGELGDGTFAYKNLPQHVLNLSGVKAIANGYYHNMALKNDGTVWAWGNNEHGQLGDGTCTNQNLPVQVQNLNGIIAIAIGEYHSLALRNDGTVWAWGINCGDGTGAYHNLPVQVLDLNGVTAIAGGGWHSMALKSDGTVWTWGYNNWGELGDGTGSNQDRPVQVSNLYGVKAIAGGGAHSLAIGNDGTVWSWGRNDAGQVGDGSGATQLIPVQVSGLYDVKAISGGVYHSLAITNSGTLWTWGANSYGQLGDGTFINHYTPIQISF